MIAKYWFYEFISSISINQMYQKMFPYTSLQKQNTFVIGLSDFYSSQDSWAEVLRGCLPLLSNASEKNDF